MSISEIIRFHWKVAASKARREVKPLGGADTKQAIERVRKAFRTSNISMPPSVNFVLKISRTPEDVSQAIRGMVHPTPAKIAVCDIQRAFNASGISLDGTNSIGLSQAKTADQASRAIRSVVVFTPKK